MFARINEADVFETEVQSALRKENVAQFVNSPKIEFDIDRHFRYFVLLELGDKVNEIKGAVSRVDYLALLRSVPATKSVFELTCYLELYIAGRVNQRVLKTEPNPEKLNSQEVLGSYDVFMTRYAQLIAANPAAGQEVS